MNEKEEGEGPSCVFGHYSAIHHTILHLYFLENPPSPPSSCFYVQGKFFLKDYALMLKMPHSLKNYLKNKNILNLNI